jgi:very-short-patch-repair endonuclease
MATRRRHDYADDLAWHIERAAIPQPEREFRFAAPRRFRFDFAWPDRKIALEVDGGRWMPGGGRHASDGDYEKLNIAASLGWRVLRVSSEMVRKDPLGVVDMLKTVLRENDGHSG